MAAPSTGSFAWALECMRIGQCVSREAWQPYRWAARPAVRLAELGPAQAGGPVCFFLMVTPRITGSETVLGWHASAADCLADDWRVVAWPT